jgi:hypothetical protein
MSGFFPHCAFDLKIAQNDLNDVSTLIPQFFIMKMNPYRDVFISRHRQIQAGFRFGCGDPPVTLLLCHMWVLSFKSWGVMLMEGSRR